MKPVVAISGGFDPFHPGHLFLIDRAAKLGELVVIVNSDDFLIRKRRRLQQPEQPLLCLAERITIIEHIKGVSRVVACVDEDDTVCRTLEMLQPTIFVNSGDRRDTNALPSPEVATCRRIGCQMVFFRSPYHNHSRNLLANYREGAQR